MSWIDRSAPAILALGLAPALASACGGTEGPGATGAGGGGTAASTAASTSASTDKGGAGGGGPTYATSMCGQCVETKACVSELNACAADASCGAYLDRLDACPPGASGDVDAACEMACPKVSGSAGMAAKSAFDACRRSDASATTCPSCGSISLPKDPDFHQQCGPSAEPNKCYKCEDEHCCNTYQACAADPDCKAIAPCVAACPDILCEDKCYQDHAAGYALYGHRIACLTYFCLNETFCNDEAPEPCQTCLNLWCADADAACSHDLACRRLDDCQGSCGATDKACFDACNAKFPTAVATHDASNQCGLTHCMAVCQ